MKRLIKCIAFTAALPLCTNAQSVSNNVIASGGTRLQKDNVVLEFTLGETAINTLTSSTNKITQGFHQPNIVVSKVENVTPGINVESSAMKTKNEPMFKFDVYPNPVTDFLNMRASNLPKSKCMVQLIDESGRIVRELSITNTETRLYFTQLAAGKYFIIATTADGKNKESFKVIKLRQKSNSTLSC